MKTEQEVLAKIGTLEAEITRSQAIIKFIEEQDQINQEDMSRLLNKQKEIKSKQAEIITLRWVLEAASGTDRNVSPGHSTAEMD